MPAPPAPITRTSVSVCIGSLFMVANQVLRRCGPNPTHWMTSIAGWPRGPRWIRRWIRDAFAFQVRHHASEPTREHRHSPADTRHWCVLTNRDPRALAPPTEAGVELGATDRDRPAVGRRT